MLYLLYIIYILLVFNFDLFAVFNSDPGSFTRWPFKWSDGCAFKVILFLTSSEIASMMQCSRWLFILSMRYSLSGKSIAVPVMAALTALLEGAPGRVNTAMLNPVFSQLSHTISRFLNASLRSSKVLGNSFSRSGTISTFVFGLGIAAMNISRKCTLKRVAKLDYIAFDICQIQ